MNNLSSYCGLDDGEIRASDKDLPVNCSFCHINKIEISKPQTLPMICIFSIFLCYHHLFEVKMVETNTLVFYTLKNFKFKVLDCHTTLPIAKILSVKNARAWVSMVSYLKK